MFLCSMVIVLRLYLCTIIHDDGDMGRPLMNPVGPATGARHKALGCRPFIGENRLNDQIVRHHLKVKSRR